MMMGSLLTLASAGESPNPIHHVINQLTVEGPNGWWIWSSNQTNLVLSMVIVLVCGWLAARHIRTGDASEGHDRYLTKNPLAGLIEVISLFLRDEICKPVLGERTNRFMPFLWTLFYFILVNNLLGLIPLGDGWNVVRGEVGHTSWIGGTATQNLYVTGALAAVSFFVINIAGMRELGVGGYCKHLTAGTSGPVAFLMVPIEIIGTIVKPCALALRLFANMTAGHILVATLFMFVGMALNQQTLLMKIALGGSVTLASAVAACAVYFLELFVAFLQAFVFMFLTAVFIGQLSHHGDHEHDEHAHAEAHGEAAHA
ncbi:MAG: F0F1 ATP synthase subunit A [Phycisphaeraceae bacterium]|nr:MAG: F0F1 ATP synthase subunit A [Phycisphaeraceae bacterium]